MSKTLDEIKQISSLAFFSFILGIFWWTLPILELYVTPLKSIPCSATLPGGLSAILLGVIGLFYIRKKNLKGRLFVILGCIRSFGYPPCLLEAL